MNRCVRAWILALLAGTGAAQDFTLTRPRGAAPGDALTLRLYGRGLSDLCGVIAFETGLEFGEIKTELLAHRAAEPGITSGLRRPYAFDKAAQNDSLVVGQARFEQTVDAQERSRRRRTPNDDAGEGSVEDFRIVGSLDRKSGW